VITRRGLFPAVSLAAQTTRPKPRTSAPKRVVGITMMPEFIQNEGIDGVLKNLAERAGVTAVTTSPYVMEPASEKTGSREPPIDAGAGKVRLLDRPLWGQRELWVRTAPSFAFEPRLFEGLRYQPTAANELTRKQGGLLRDFIREAQRRKLKVYFQVQAAIPPGYRVQFGGPADDDRPRLPDGRIPARTLSNNGSLGSRNIRAYLLSLIRDVFRVYPEIDGLRLDWPEYPPYFLDDCFTDFSDHAAAAAGRAGVTFTDARQEASEWYARLHGKLTNTNAEKEIAAFAKLNGGSWGRLKQALAYQLLQEAREAVDESGGRGKELIPNAFPPPFSAWGGLTPNIAATAACDGISVKCYTMHWPMMLRFYAEALLRANPGLNEARVVPALASWLRIADAGRYRTLADCRYPEPTEPHGANPAVLEQKITEARRGARLPVYALSHGYGPLDDFRARLRGMYQASAGRVWINRYGYLSDAKLEAVKEVCR